MKISQPLLDLPCFAQCDFQIGLRTKRWMHEKDFSKCFLFYPEVAAAECLPQGLPAGKVCTKYPPCSIKLVEHKFFRFRLQLSLFFLLI